jgi:hypothetical protein
VRFGGQHDIGLAALERNPDKVCPFAPAAGAALRRFTLKRAAPGYASGMRRTESGNMLLRWRPLGEPRR